MIPPKCGTHSGLLFDLVNPDYDEVNIEDIVFGLSRQMRFNGHTKFPYSVAQHSMFVAELMPPELAAYGLLHDAHEAYMGDITSPVKSAMHQLGGYQAITALDDILSAATHKKFGLQWPLPKDIEHEVTKADKLAAQFEKAHLLNMDFDAPFELPARLMKYMTPHTDEIIRIEFAIKLKEIEKGVI